MGEAEGRRRVRGFHVWRWGTHENRGISMLPVRAARIVLLQFLACYIFRSGHSSEPHCVWARRISILAAFLRRMVVFVRLTSSKDIGRTDACIFLSCLLLFS